jgi:hypothetical protein
VTRRCAVLAVVLAACGGAPPPPRPYPGTLRPPATLGPDVVLRQRIVARWDAGGETLAFDAVVQKRGDTLTVLTLAPWGGRALLVEHDGTGVHVTRYVDRDLPFPPRYVLLDVQRAFFLPVTDPAPPDGARTERTDGEIVVETWRGGRLRSRSFRREDGAPPGEIVVRYDGGIVSGERPPRTELRNGWFGYTLEVTTTERIALSPGPDPPALHRHAAPPR